MRAGCQQCVEPGVAGSLVAGLVARVRRARCWGHVHSVCLVWHWYLVGALVVPLLRVVLGTAVTCRLVVRRVMCRWVGISWVGRRCDSCTCAAYVSPSCLCSYHHDLVEVGRYCRCSRWVGGCGP